MPKDMFDFYFHCFCQAFLKCKLLTLLLLRILKSNISISMILKTKCANYNYVWVYVSVYISTYAPVQMIMFVSHDHSVLQNLLSESDLSICLLQCLRYSMNCHFIWMWLFKNMWLFYSVWECAAKTASHAVRLHEYLAFNLRGKKKIN